ncbi:GNAT family N-acetyltransferase [Candidatus Amarolinea aalborgensis]|uniref:GNAT family N-acetyltransferase n=1 Tax=Candidatus Amarolinea aalborgensis TaxID=2249329 RepID=UPI003BF9CDFB
MTARTPVSLRPLGADDVIAVQAVYEATPGYFELMTGAPAPAYEAQREFDNLARQPGRLWLGLFVPDEAGLPDLIGLLDLRLGFPEPQIVTLGLLLVCEARQRQGFGSQAYRLIEGWLRQQGFSAVELHVAGQAFGVQQFWRRLGFEFTGQQRRVALGRKSVRLLALSKSLAPMRGS